MDLSLSFGRFMTGALIAAALAVGGVWFVVDVSLRGIEGNVVTTNKRIDDLQGQIERRFDELNRRLDRDFAATANRIERRAALEELDNPSRLLGLPFISSDGTRIGRVASVNADGTGLTIETGTDGGSGGASIAVTGQDISQIDLAPADARIVSTLPSVSLQSKIGSSAVQ